MTKVLVVDDSALMRRRIGQILTDGGFEVVTARNGADALAMLADVAPDVVTLDINMPEMDGLTCLAAIMSRRPTPVIMISSLTEHGALATLEALELGAIDYVHKPDGTVSLAIGRAEAEIVAKVKAAATARIRRSRGLGQRLRAERQKVMDSPPPRPKIAAAREGLVLIGVSTGGPSTLEEVLSPLRPDFPLPVVVAQHMPATFTGPLAQRLGNMCALNVQEVRQPTPLAPGNVYIGRGDADIVVSRRGTQLVVASVPIDQALLWHPSAGRMVESAGKVLPAASMIGVMLTGMGDDGAEQMAALCKAGGHTIAESEETCVVFGMPQALIRLGGADRVLDSDKIGRQLNDWAFRLVADDAKARRA